MKKYPVRAAIACTVMLLMATPAMEAEIGPAIAGGIIASVLVSPASQPRERLAKNDQPRERRAIASQPGTIVKQTQTDGSGKLRFEGLVPGDYTLVVDCQSLATEMNKLASASPAKKRASGLSFNIVGGSFRGGSSATVAGISPYCHGRAGQSIPVGFSIPKGAGGVTVSVAYTR